MIRPRESATDRLIMREVENRLAKLDELLDVLRRQVAECPDAPAESIAQRLFLLEHRIALLEEALEDRWGARDA